MTDDELRDRIRAKFRSGELPMKQPVKTWGGDATKTTCAVCDAPIQTVSEIEADSADGRTRFYHLRCYQLTVVERELIRCVRETT